MTSKITVPEQAYRELLCGGDPQEIASRCEIGFPFERRDWLATVSTMGLAIEFSLVVDPKIDELVRLTLLLNEMIQSHLNDSLRGIGK